MTTAHNEYTTELGPATPEEVEWAFEVATTGFENDMIRRGIIAADDEDEALRFVRYHQNGGGCGPSGAPGGNIRGPTGTVPLAFCVRKRHYSCGTASTTSRPSLGTTRFTSAESLFLILAASTTLVSSVT